MSLPERDALISTACSVLVQQKPIKLPTWPHLIDRARRMRHAVLVAAGSSFSPATRLLSLPLVILLCILPTVVNANPVRRADPLRFIPSGIQPAQCADYTTTWEGGTPPFKFQFTTDPSLRLTVGLSTADRKLVWTEPFPAGAVLVLSLTDSTGQTVFSPERLVVQPSSNRACLIVDSLDPPGRPVRTTTRTPTPTPTTSPPPPPPPPLPTTTSPPQKPSEPTRTTPTIPPANDKTDVITVTVRDSSSSSSTRPPTPSLGAFNTARSTSSLETISEPTSSSSSSSSAALTSTSSDSEAAGPTALVATTGSDDARAGLSSGAVIGIAIGGAVVLLIGLAIVLYYLVCRLRARRAALQPGGESSKLPCFALSYYRAGRDL
ncbi:hypothetical protein C8Q76DRAFT_114046 [Earliella scabrosa]|nr:hypothetical protein C8Q76DRAFT_114046 [Earliella scabrosa]